ncbi:unnamed protein product [Calypogeia fissa]
MRLILKARAQFMNMTAPAACGCRRLLTSDDTPVEEFLDKHLATPTGAASPLIGITTTRREVLSLYRDIWRATRVFTWADEQGVPWKDVLRLSARREFEAAKFERDPETVAKLVVVGRDAVRMTLEKFHSKREQLVTDSNPDPTRRP